MMRLRQLSCHRDLLPIQWNDVNMNDLKSLIDEIHQGRSFKKKKKIGFKCWLELWLILWLKLLPMTWQDVNDIESMINEIHQGSFTQFKKYISKGGRLDYTYRVICAGENEIGKIKFCN